MIDFDRLLHYLQEPSVDSIQVRLRDALMAQLTDGTFKPGDAFPSEAVLQEKIGVGANIIHPAVQGFVDTRLIEITTNGEIYVLKTPEAAVPTQMNQIVGLIAGQPNFHVYYGQMAAAFNHCLQSAGWTIELALCNEQIDTLREIINQMMQRNVRVFSINPPSRGDIRPILDDIRARGALVQLIGRPADYPECDFVGADHEQIGYLATRRLIELGHSQIVYVGGAFYSTSSERANGYVRAMKEARLSPRLFNIRSSRPAPIPPELQAYMDPENTRTALWREMVRRRVTAAFCFNYNDAIWVYNETRKFNLQVPRDISLITVDNPPAEGYTGVSLATFALPGEEMGCQAANLLLRRLAGEDFPPQKILLPGQFIPQPSIGAPRDRYAA
jgi:LacI family transcriptional regulator